MPEYTVTDMEVVKEIPGNPQEKGGPAQVLKLSLEEDERQPELFTVKSTPLPTVGEKYEGTIEESPYGPKFKRPGGRQGGGGGGYRNKMDPAEAKMVQRQHSQEMALQRERDVIASGGRPYNGEQLRSVINWFEQDIATKDRSVTWDGLTSDVPADLSGTPLEGS